MHGGAGRTTAPIANHRLRRWPAWPTAIIRYAALTLALLNPLLCVLHCSLSHQHPALRADAQPAFLCQLARDTPPAAAPFERVWDGPRAVYELTPLGALALALIIFIVTAVTAPQPHAPQHITRPSAPPPKIGLRSNPA